MDELKKMCEDWNLSSDEIVEEEENDSLDSVTETNLKDEVKTLQEVIEKQGINGLRQTLRDNADKWKTTVLHIAVTGSSGAGKSAFINAIRDIEAEDEGGAEVGVVETTKTLKQYKHPKNPNFVVWDMPGVGTPEFPMESYLERVMFEQYDFFMIISKDRFTKEDLWLATQTQKQSKRFYFVRSHIDDDIRNDSRANKKHHSPDKVLSSVRLDCLNNLKEAGITCPFVFLVDSLDRQSFEFGLLEAQLLQDSDSIKINAMALSLSALTKEVLQKKKDVLEDRIENKAMEIACMDNVTERKKTYDSEIANYMDQFNLDGKTLEDNKDILSLSGENLAEFQSFFKGISLKSLKGLATARSKETFVGRLRRMIYKMYGLGLSESIPVFTFSSLSLNQNLEEIYRMALNVYGVNAQKGLVQAEVMTSGE